MAQRGRPKKIQTVEPTVAVTIDHAKLLKQFEQEQRVQLETFYKDLAKIKHNVSVALNKIGFIDSCENLAEAAFKAGRAYDQLDEANDKLEELLDEMYNSNLDLDHWDDINED
jgi:ABC-type enterochelin transport system substrate-binding protein